MSRMFTSENISDLPDRAFPPVIEQRLMMFEKHVPEKAILDYLVKLLDEIQFPDIHVQMIPLSGTGSQAIKPALTGRTNETGLLIRHYSEVFQTVSVLFRAINFGKITLVGEYKCSDYEHKTQAISSCCSNTQIKSLSLKTTPQGIVNGALVTQRFSDGSHVDIMKTPGQAPNMSITRNELYHSFFFLTDSILFPKLEAFIKNYEE